MSTSSCCESTTRTVTGDAIEGGTSSVTASAPGFDVDRCTRAFASVDEARDFMLAKDYDGHVLLRGDGSYTAVCPTYPDGFYPDATVVATICASEVGQASGDA